MSALSPARTVVGAATSVAVVETVTRPTFTSGGTALRNACAADWPPARPLPFMPLLISTTSTALRLASGIALAVALPTAVATLSTGVPLRKTRTDARSTDSPAGRPIALNVTSSWPGLLDWLSIRPVGWTDGVAALGVGVVAAGAAGGRGWATAVPLNPTLAARNATGPIPTASAAIPITPVAHAPARLMTGSPPGPRERRHSLRSTQGRPEY